MEQAKKGPLMTLGVMSGTSIDGVDVVGLHTDGETHVDIVGHHYLPYPKTLVEQLRTVSLGDIPLMDVLRLEKILSDMYAMALAEAPKTFGWQNRNVDVVGVHGQTVRHLPEEGLTWQLGDVNRVAAGLAEAGFTTDAIMDFRRRDMALGGQGAPLVPLFHEQLLRGKTSFPVAGLNIGGVANITLLSDDTPVTAADTGPGMGLLDQLFLARTGDTIDDKGAITISGKADATIVNRLTTLPYYQRPFPRSADRYEFTPLLEAVKDMDLPHAAATLAAVTARGVAHTVAEHGWTHKRILWCGGGGRNLGIIEALKKEGFDVAPMAEITGVREDWVEAACFGWLAVRHLRGLPFSLPTTTGCCTQSVGGVKVRA